MILSPENGEAAEYQIMGEGATVRAQIFYDEMEGVLGPQIIPEEKATLDDFKHMRFSCQCAVPLCRAYCEEAQDHMV